MINFDKLPTGVPSASLLIPEGRYIGTIIKAEMKQPNDTSRPMYLNITWDIKDEAGKAYGKLFDKITESDSPYMLYKLRCFVTAIGINLGNQFELKDLTKVVTGKSCEIAINTDTKSDPNKSQVNMFATEMFRALEPKNNSDIPFETGEAATEPNADSDY